MKRFLLFCALAFSMFAQAQSPADAVRELTITLVPSAVEVRQAVLGEKGAIEALGAGKTLVDLSGTDPE